MKYVINRYVGDYPPQRMFIGIMWYFSDNRILMEFKNYAHHLSRVEEPVKWVNEKEFTCKGKTYKIEPLDN